MNRLIWSSVCEFLLLLPLKNLVWTVVALTFVIALGLSKLAYPLMGDQALFLLGGRTIDGGGILYRDFWDIKPPGIFLFYFIAGKLFGFSEMRSRDRVGPKPSFLEIPEYRFVCAKHTSP